MHNNDIQYSMCLYTEQYTADQTLTNEKHVYIKAFFRHRDVVMQHMHALPQAPGIALLDMRLRQVGASGEFGPLFGCL
jgi:hypothetical protein